MTLGTVPTPPTTAPRLQQPVPTPRARKPELYCIVDTETNGLPDADHRVGPVEIGMVIIDSTGELVASASAVIAPAVWPVEDQVLEAEGIHGMPRAWVDSVGVPALQPRTNPAVNTVSPALLSWLSQRRMLAWNAKFDFEILRRSRTLLSQFAHTAGWNRLIDYGGATEFAGHALPVPGCLRSLAADALGSPDPTAEPPLLDDGCRASLARVAERLGVPPSPGAHRALTDALQTAAVVRALLRRLQARHAGGPRG